MINVNSDTWLTIKAVLEGRLMSLREQNDRVIPQNQTDAIRGEIKAVKDILALPVTLAARDTTGNLGYEVGSTDDID